MNDRFLSLLGISRRAQKLCCGHDSVKEAVNSSKAKLVLFTSDSSERLREEFRQKLEENKIQIIYTDYTMNEIYCATSSRAAVMCLTDEGFAKRLTELFNNKHKEA